MHENKPTPCCASQENCIPATTYREHCKAIMSNLVECHSILNELIGAEDQRDEEKYPIPDCCAVEVSQNLAEIQDRTRVLLQRLRRTFDKF